jgi:hypothetical protein
MRASSEQRAHPGADALTERLRTEAHERLLNGLTRVAIALFRPHFELVADCGEAPRDGRV